MKKPIQWHRDCLKNMIVYSHEKQRQAERANADSERVRRDIEFLELQIESAEKAGKDGFDSEKFMAKSKAK